MIKYLDSTGLSYFWNKLKSIFATKTEVSSIAQDATATAQQAAQYAQAIHEAITGLDPSQSTEDAISELSAQIVDTQTEVTALDSKVSSIIGVKDKLVPVTSATVYSTNKKMTNNNEVLVFESSTTQRVIVCFDVADGDDSVVYRIDSVQSDNSALGYAFVDENNNIIKSATGTTTAGNKVILVSLVGVKKIYVSVAKNSTEATIRTIKWGEDNQVAQTPTKTVNCSNRLVSFGNCLIGVDNNNHFYKDTSNNTRSTQVALISGYKTIEGLGYAKATSNNWVILDKNLTVVATNYNSSSAYDTRTLYQELPQGAKLLIFSDKQGATTADYTSNYYLGTVPYKNEYKILVVGNSFTQCYWTYVPYILNHIFGEDYKFTIVVGMYGASTTSAWNNWLSSGSQSMYCTVNNKWYSWGNKTAAELFSSVDFDLVGFQQQSDSSDTYSTWSSIWDEIVTKVSSLSSKRVDLMWTMVHSKPTSANVSSSDTVMQRVFNANSSFEQDYPIDICPVGTAIQNARHTDINNLTWEGSYGQLTPDNQHLQNGFACFIAGWVVAKYIAKKLGFNVSCYGDNMRVNAAFDATIRKLTTYGSVVYADNDALYTIAQKCIENAIRFPYQIKS